MPVDLLQIFLGNSDEIKSKLLLSAKADVCESFKNSDRNFDSCKKAANFAYCFLRIHEYFLVNSFIIHSSMTKVVEKS